MEEKSMLQTRLDEILEEMGNAEPGSEHYRALVEDYTKMSQVATAAYKAEADDLNSRDKNAVEQEKVKADERKSRRDLIGRIGTSVIGAGVTVFGMLRIGKIEEFGAVTSKILGQIPKWKF